MNLARIIPVLLLSDSGMVKTTKFNSPIYVGDPINAVRIFNAKEVDEIIILDIDATRYGKGPNFERIEQIASEAFMPLGYGGGVKTTQQMEQLFRIGIEKVVINTAIHENRKLLNEASNIFGSQSIVASIDVKKDILGRYHVYSKCGKKREDIDLKSYISLVQEQGAGEIILNSIDKDGTMSGYDLKLLSNVSGQLNVPLVALGGAGSVKHFDDALQAGASSVSAGSLFIFHGRHRAVLLSYISPDKLNTRYSI
uniref:AglZ/HisF2 family acetamidino modification protein n=1 Tax=Limnohabitans sp. TaxID=1907725 RepID=UPI0040470C4E